MGVREFHIHVDAKALDPSVVRLLTSEGGFVETNFCGHPESVQHFEPMHHLTMKCYSGRDFRSNFRSVMEYLSSTTMRGYLEGEAVASNTEIPAATFDPSVPLDLRLNLRMLARGEFRETEIHITMDRDRSDPRLLDTLSRTGMFAAYLPKPYGTAIVFTVQGDRRRISELLPILTDYLRRAGGAVACAVKEERIVSWWLSHDDVELPPVVQDILSKP